MNHMEITLFRFSFLSVIITYVLQRLNKAENFLHNNTIGNVAFISLFGGVHDF